MSPLEPSAAFAASKRARATIFAVGVGFILLMHAVQPVLLGVYGRLFYLRLSFSIASTLIQLAVATLVARHLERRGLSVVTVALVACVAATSVHRVRRSLECGCQSPRNVSCPCAKL